MANKPASITITGTAKVGETLTATVSDANGVPSSVAYQWLADNAAISGATAKTYVLKVAEVGKAITVKATFTDNDGYPESATSAASVPVAPIASPLIFSIMYNHVYPTKNVFVTLTNPTGEWVLKESGVVLADSSGFKGSGTTTSPVVNGIKIILDGSKSGNRSYELSGSAGLVNFSNNYDLSSTANNALTVHAFSDSIARFEFHLPTFYIEVPKTLPAHVTSMSSMFWSSVFFNGDISAWDTSRITNMSTAFRGCMNFNCDISGWDVSKVTSMWYMMGECTYFNKDLSKWCVSKIPTKPDYFDANANSWKLPKPVWGTCPRGENTLPA